MECVFVECCDVGLWVPLREEQYIRLMRMARAARWDTQWQHSPWLQGVCGGDDDANDDNNNDS